MTPWPRPLTALTLAALLQVGAPAGAQTLPSRPIELADGQLVLSAEVGASISAEDRPGYFNYTDYEHSALRLFQAALTAAWQPASRLAFLTEIRSENLETPRVYAALVRVRPLVGRAFDIQAGRIPPSFGAYGRRGYGLDNPVVGYPLAYQYLTSLRGDALPATADAQAEKTRRIGFLGAATSAGYAPQLWVLRQGLRDLGWIEGKNLAIEYRWAEDRYERLPDLALALLLRRHRAVREHEASNARRSEVMYEVLNPCIICIAWWGCSI